MALKEWELDQAIMPLIGKVVAGTATAEDRLAIENNARARVKLMTPPRPSTALIRKTRRALARQR